jgi:hypothetical protein
MNLIINVRAKTPLTGLFFILWLPICLVESITLSRKSKDPYLDSFYEKTHLIMRDKEKNIEKSLPDETSKREFIEEF